MTHHRTLVTAALMASGTGAATCANPQYGLERQAFDVAVSQGLPPSIFVAMIGTESHFCPATVSDKGAVGLGQLMPGTARDLRVTNPLNIAQNLNASAVYLRAQFKTFGRWDLALAAYNAGAGNVQKYGGVPPFAETIAHVDKVLTRAAALERGIPLITALNTPVAQLRTLPSPARPQVTLLAASQAPAPRSVTGVQAPITLVSSPAAQGIAGGAGTASRSTVQPVPASLKPTASTATSRPAGASAAPSAAANAPRGTHTQAAPRPAQSAAAASARVTPTAQNTRGPRIETTTLPPAGTAPAPRTGTPATPPPSTASTTTPDGRILVVIRRAQPTTQTPTPDAQLPAQGVPGSPVQRVLTPQDTSAQATAPGSLMVIRVRN